MGGLSGGAGLSGGDGWSGDAGLSPAEGLSGGEGFFGFLGSGFEGGFDSAPSGFLGGRFGFSLAPDDGGAAAVSFPVSEPFDLPWIISSQHWSNFSACPIMLRFLRHAQDSSPVTEKRKETSYCAKKHRPLVLIDDVFF